MTDIERFQRIEAAARAVVAVFDGKPVGLWPESDAIEALRTALTGGDNEHK